MKIAIPDTEYRGLESPVCGHFGSAPAFALVDSETMSTEAIVNRDREHTHGVCSPMKALAGAKPDAVLAGGIGAGALSGLRRAGITVCRAPDGTVADALRLFKAGQLEELDTHATCAGHAGPSPCHGTH